MCSRLILALVLLAVGLPVAAAAAQDFCMDASSFHPARVYRTNCYWPATEAASTAYCSTWQYQGADSDCMWEVNEGLGENTHVYVYYPGMSSQLCAAQHSSSTLHTETCAMWAGGFVKRGLTSYLDLTRMESYIHRPFNDTCCGVYGAKTPVALPPSPPPSAPPPRRGFPFMLLLQIPLILIVPPLCILKIRMKKRHAERAAERARQLAAAQSSTGMQPVAQAYAQPQPMAVTCPPGVKPGDSLVVTMGGQQVTVQVPEGVTPGGMFMVQPPQQQAVAVAVATAIPA